MQDFLQKNNRALVAKTFCALFWGKFLLGLSVFLLWTCGVGGCSACGV